MAAFNEPREIGVAQYLTLHIEEVGDGTAPLPRTRGEFPGSAVVLDAEGRLATGLLTAVVDGIGGMTSGLASLPDWIVTTNLALRRADDALIGPRGTGSLVVDVQVLRRGRSSVVTRADVTSTAGDTVATCWLTCAVLTPEGGPPQFVRPVGRLERIVPDEPIFRAPPAEFFGLEAGARPGEVVLHPTPRLRNPWGILHGGATAVVLDAAARGLVTGIVDPAAVTDAIVTDLVVHYLSPGRVGPLVARASAVGGPSGDTDHLVRVEVRDRGADDRMVALAMTTVRRLGTTDVRVTGR